MKQFLFLNAFAYCRCVEDYIKILNHQSTVIQIMVTTHNLSAFSARSTDSLLNLNVKICICKNKGRCSERLILLKKSQRSYQNTKNGKWRTGSHCKQHGLLWSAEALWPEAGSHGSVGSSFSPRLHSEPFFAMALMCMVCNMYRFPF